MYKEIYKQCCPLALSTHFNDTTQHNTKQGYFFMIFLFLFFFIFIKKGIGIVHQGQREKCIFFRRVWASQYSVAAVYSTTLIYNSVGIRIKQERVYVQNLTEFLYAYTCYPRVWVNTNPVWFGSRCGNILVCSATVQHAIS